MAKKQPPQSDEPPDRGDTPRAYKNVGIPLSLWEELKEAADQEERSVNWMAKKAIREYLDRRKADEGK